MVKKILFAAPLAVMIIIYSFWVNDDLSDNMVRFHVIANSNSEEDQKLKRSVRDAVAAEAEIITEGTKSKAEAASLLRDNSHLLKKTAQEVVVTQGYSYPVTVEYGNFFFPEKRYGRLTLPSGKYDAMRVRIGEAKGENWWCVMFPPLCISEDCFAEADDEALSYLKGVLSEDEYRMITESDERDVFIRFRIVDTVMKLASFISK